MIHRIGDTADIVREAHKDDAIVVASDYVDCGTFGELPISFAHKRGSIDGPFALITATLGVGEFEKQAEIVARFITYLTGISAVVYGRRYSGTGLNRHNLPEFLPRLLLDSERYVNDHVSKNYIGTKDKQVARIGHSAGFIGVAEYMATLEGRSDKVVGWSPLGLTSTEHDHNQYKLWSAGENDDIRDNIDKKAARIAVRFGIKAGTVLALNGLLHPSSWPDIDMVIKDELDAFKFDPRMTLGALRYSGSVSVHSALKEIRSMNPDTKLVLKYGLEDPIFPSEELASSGAFDKLFDIVQTFDPRTTYAGHCPAGSIFGLSQLRETVDKALISIDT